MEWLRWHHGTVGDPKLRMVAAEAGQPVAIVIAVWASLLECASLASDRGSISDFSPKLCAFTIGVEPAAVLAVLTAMREADMLVDDRVKAWDKRQPAREDDGATDRKRRQRERERTARDVDNVTQGHASSRSDTLRHKADSEAENSVNQSDENSVDVALQHSMESTTCSDVTHRHAMSRQIDREDRKKDSPLPPAAPKSEQPKSPRAKPAPASGEAEDFVRFYDLYPRHEGRGQARRAWLAAASKAKPEAIMAGLARAIARWRANGTEQRYIPLPATWLNGERWGDESEQPKSKGPTSGYASIVS